jgi:hypothetical protein
MRPGVKGGQVELGVEGSLCEGDGQRDGSRNPVAAVGDQLDLDLLVAVEHRSVLTPAAAGDPDAAFGLVVGVAVLGV